jgi:hypothetical protein
LKLSIITQFSFISFWVEDIKARCDKLPVSILRRPADAVAEQSRKKYDLEHFLYEIKKNII